MGYRLSCTVCKQVNKRAIEQGRGGVFILLALCFLSLHAPSVGDG